MFRHLIKIASILALIVVVLGAYTRLSDAGLGCPDWPTCYGKISVSNIETPPPSITNLADWRSKAWKEMVHRYAASLLGLLIVVMTIIALGFKSSEVTYQHKKTTIFLLVLVIFQGLLGMLTVTELLNPVVVVLHLLGGMGTVSLLFWLWLGDKSYFIEVSQTTKKLAILALIVVLIQIMFGGWTSANYAALSCGTDFPTCLGSWLPEAAEFSQAILPVAPLGINYEYGVLESGARIAIQLLHRVGAVLVLIIVGLLWFKLRHYPKLVMKSTIILLLLGLQVLLGILNVMLSLPIFIAVMHNLIALLLLLSILNIIYLIRLQATGNRKQIKATTKHNILP